MNKLFAVVVALTAAAQTPTARPLAFEVASVRASQSQDMRDSGVQYLPGRFLAKNRPVGFLLLEAFNTIPQLLVTAGADQRTLNLFYDIEAVPEKSAIAPNATKKDRDEKLRLMLQSLLTDRFKMKTHRESKSMPVYAITIAAGGNKLKKAPLEEKDCADQDNCHVFGGGPPSGIQGKAIDLSDLARALSTFSDRPVIDKTGIPGLYTIQTAGWTDIRPRPPRPGGGTPEQRAEDAVIAAQASFTSALSALGLRLEPQTALIESIVIDHIEPPSGN